MRPPARAQADDDNGTEELETYHPRALVRQNSIQVMQAGGEAVDGSQQGSGAGPSAPKPRSAASWLPRLSSGLTGGKHGRGRIWSLGDKMARLSSLDSTRSSSSIEGEPGELAPRAKYGGGGPGGPSPPPLASSARRYGGRRQGWLADEGLDEEQDLEDEDEEEFADGPAPLRLAPGGRSQLAQQVAAKARLKAAYEARLLLDDRQGMNDIEQQLTRAEAQNRPSVDGSIISELRMDVEPDSSPSGKLAGGRKQPTVVRVTVGEEPSSGSSLKPNSSAGALGPGSVGTSGSPGGRRLAAGGKLSKDKLARRSKSPSSGSYNQQATSRHRSQAHRHQRRGLLGWLMLSSHLKLSRKHQSLAKLQLSILNSPLVNLKSLDRDLLAFLPRDRLNPAEFEQRVELMRQYKVLSRIEYRFASRYEIYVCRDAMREVNQIKNNYKKCIPYDYNRVVLKTLPDTPDSDYINASHIDSCLKPNAYIACQGPNENTIEDFWRMIWEQKTFVVVMLTKVFDFIRVMCNQYWPVEVNKPERYGNLEVTLLYEEPLADFVIRTIRLTRLKGTRGRKPSAADQQQQQQPKGSAGDGNSPGATSDEACSDAELGATRSPRGSGAAAAASRPRHSSGQASTGTGTDRLHPLFAAAASGGSGAAGTSPPGTPRTPSSAGLDRSSATRRAVKKKRRARAKDSRPLRTQFQLPTEEQLAYSSDSEGYEQAEGLNHRRHRTSTYEDNQLASTQERLDERTARSGYKKSNNHDDQYDSEPCACTTAEPDEIVGCAHERIIYQFHYSSWASHTCPFIGSLLHFRRRVRICMDEMSKSGKTGPTVVHCNDGCGRTGAYLCIDANLELAEEDGVYDVFNYTKKMRQSRKLLIENLEQYRFVYETIEESMYCGKTWFPVPELSKQMKRKSQRNPLTKKNEYQREYDKITHMTSKFSIGDCAGGHRVENREKNRDVSTVPPDNFRPYLNSFQSNDSTDYINAVFVDGYTRSKEYIVTEWPLHKTISDFWSLVYDYDCNSVILLANPAESSTYPSFLPTEKELRRKFGPVFSAEMVSYTHYQNIKSWIYTINKKIVSLTEVIAGVKSEAKTTQVFQITCWPCGQQVPASTNALVELMNMVERWRLRTAHGHVCVVSLNGKSRAGVYCAANVAIEQVLQHSEVDVFQAVKTVRRHRPQLIENMTEYKYCYDLILHYVLHYVNQSSAGG